MPAPMGNRYATRSQRSSNVAKKAARNAMMKVPGGTANTNVKTAVNTDTNDPTAGVTQNQLDRVVQSVNDATNRLSQPESAFSISTTTKSSKRRSRDTVGPWKLGKTLGKGSSGRVRLAKNMETGQLAAIKIVPKKKCKNDPGSHSSSKSTESDFSATMNTTTNTNRATTNGGTNANAGPSEVPANPYGIEREIVIMKLISHSNILGLYEVWENKSELYLVLEYVDGGELFDYLVSRGKLGEREAVHYFKQIVQGVSYCHSFNICHRDLKPENLLLDKKNKSIKIADFGMAALEVSNKLLQTSCGSPHYASPEIVMGRPYHGGPSDVWSCGIILFALLTGHLPFNDDNIKKLLLKVQSGKFHMPQNLSAEAKDLMSKILVVNPFKRIATEEILNHPLLTKYDKLVKPVKYRSSVNPVALSQGKSNSDLHVLDASNSNIVDLRSREDIDDSIVSNLQILWHGASRELIVAKLLQPRMSEEKLFYSLLLSYKEKHSPKPESEAPPQFEPTQPTDEIQQPQLAPLQPPSLEPTLAPEVVQQSLPAQDEEDEEELTKSQTTNEEDSSQLNESQDTSAPKLPQKSQFSASSIDQHSMSGFSSMQSAALSGVPSVPANSLPPAMPIFTAPSSRTFKNSGPALSIPSKKSLKHSASKTSLNHSASKKSLHHSASRKSLVHASPSTTSLHNSASKKSLHNSPPKKTLQNSASKRSLYSQTSISKRSLNLSEYVATENAVISEMEQQLKPNLPSSESNGDFEKLCEQILFGNALEKILEEEEDDGASATTSNTSQRTLTKVDASQRSPHSSDSKNKTPAAKTIPPAFELNTPESEEEQQLRASAHKNLLAEENNRYPFKDITNNPTLAPSDSKPSKSKRDVSQKSDLSEVLNSNQFGGSTFSSNDVLRNNSRKSEFKPSLRVTNDVRSASENQSKPVQPSYSLDPRRNATQPVNPKVVASLLKRAKTKKNIRDARKSGDWSYISGSHFNTNTDINFDDKLENIFDHGFNNRLDGNLERGLVDSGLKRASEDTRSSLWQPSLRDSHVESDAEHNTSGTNEFFDTSDVNVLAHSSIIQKPNDVTRQPSLLSHTGTFKNLSEYLHKEGNANNIANRSHEENPSNVMRKKSTELNLAPRSTLTAALDPKDRSMYTNSFMSNMSDMSYVMEMPSRTYEAQAIEVSNNSSADDITDLPVNSDREFGQSSSQGQHTTATFEDNNVNIFEDAPVDSDSSDTASEDSQQNVRRKAVSIDTLHTTNVLTPATNVRVSLYLNNNNHTESPLKRETTEEIISKFKLSPEKSSQPLVQKRYSALAANRNSDIHSTMTMFKDLEEEQDAEDISQWKPSESPAGEGQEKPNRVTMLFDNEEEMPQLEHQITPTPEVPQKNENRSVPDTKSTRASEEKSMKSIDEGLQKAEELPHTNESSKQLKEPPMHAPPQPKSKVKSSGSPLPAKSKKSKPMKEKSQTATAASTATPSAPPNVSNSAAATPSSASPAPRKQNWFTKLFGGFKSQKSDLGRLQQDHFTKISFDDAHLLTLHEFDKNAVEYHLKSLDHKLHDEKVEYDCKFPTGFAFKIKITTTVLGQKNSTILTVKKKGRNTSSDVKGAFQMFNQNVANVIREAEMGYNV
ncbi:ZYRO0G03366p [Zygosaccharomyces rouxii]|uniref:non-specific serine/threonine protein kinase n=1 Tax=Zygosaccharomyces rouxii (strain ATCC 2623 / CBS 732 / NBRC 1130 / NCYC 568 / NRRL Y-229) TaxID=559307 RepID=C5DZD1_ZYGRC|nr:uncharacterized protein ZYRO0G03366g [Zygosaccharomyces rouxii]KAH9202213.1 hypothetical protein LQ764DRAFT_3371 [Zygosaccharomyces rouxii]CAR29215.1 ZYRO0G03366p [Zygosaccharomyces rouxii]